MIGLCDCNGIWTTRSDTWIQYTRMTDGRAPVQRKSFAEIAIPTVLTLCRATKLTSDPTALKRTVMKRFSRGPT